MANDANAVSPDFQERIEALRQEILPLVQKHQVDIGAALKYTERGVFPVPAYIDLKEDKKKETLLKEDEATVTYHDI